MESDRTRKLDEFKIKKNGKHDSGSFLHFELHFCYTWYEFLLQLIHFVTLIIERSIT